MYVGPCWSYTHCMIALIAAQTSCPSPSPGSEVRLAALQPPGPPKDPCYRMGTTPADDTQGRHGEPQPSLTLSSRVPPAASKGGTGWRGAGCLGGAAPARLPAEQGGGALGAIPRHAAPGPAPQPLLICIPGAHRGSVARPGSVPPPLPAPCRAPRAAGGRGRGSGEQEAGPVLPGACREQSP